jgi:ketosteroid isomerase-like protein
LNVAQAKKILEDAHALWADGNLEGVLALDVDDLVYHSHTGGLEGIPMLVEGKAAFRRYLAPLMAANQTVSTVVDFSYSTGIGRARIAIFIKHRASSHEITTTYRQIVTYRRQRMSRIDEFHDVARLSSFWRLAQQDSLIGNA